MRINVDVRRGDQVRELLDQLTQWRASGRRFAIATVVRTWKSSPRQPGAAMAVDESGEAVGSVSGGCVEAAVYDLATEVVRTGVARSVTFGVSDNDAFAVGLTCGGTIELLVTPGDQDHFPELDVLLAAIAADEPIAVATTIGAAEDDGDLHRLPAERADGIPGDAGAGGLLGRKLVITADGQRFGSLGDDRLDTQLASTAAGMLEQGRTDVVAIGRHGEQRMQQLAIFVQSFAPKPRMIVFGAIDFASAVARIGKFLGYHVVVCDARPVFATRARFPEADELVVKWPDRYLDDITVDRRTVLCVLTHDPKFDVPLLIKALKTPARYIGAMGSWRTHEDRVHRLKEAGVTDDEIARIAAPIGLDLGARTPEETAVAVAAEIIGTSWGGTGARLRDTVGISIHRERQSW